MEAASHVVVVDPVPGRADLPDRLAAMGYACTVALGLHNALVRCIMYNPRIVVLDRGGGAADADRFLERLTRLPHFDPARLLTIGGTDGDLPAMASTSEVAERVHAMISGSAPADTPSADMPVEAAAAPDREPPAPGAERTPLMVHLEEMRAALAEGTVQVIGPNNEIGEVMVRHGQPFHAVTGTGRTGEAALMHMLSWRQAVVEDGPPPREETPRSITSALPLPAETGTAALERVRPLLESLEAVGVIHKVVP